ncbi:MAG: GNAT family N-acetyltransferase [Castellaniella sp.]|uniref:GNAT family N-acetyltransferase n=1 Tax=Castellaniella sp. TaxID=1955812 RepID=UPI003C75C32A
MAARYQIRTMRRDELNFAVDLAAREGWNPGLHDAASFYAADPGGFLIGLLDDVPIGCISAVRYENGFGFLGFYIVIPEHRGRGYGMPLWRSALQQFGARNIGLDGVQAQQANYRKSGFSLAYSNIRYAWQTRPSAVQAATPHIVPAGQVDADSLARYDQPCFSTPRPTFLNAWLTQPDSVALVWREQDAIRGYGAIRRCREGWKIGPLFADHRGIAEPLLLALCHGIADDEPVYLDVPEVNTEAVRLAADLGMHKVFGTARMYRRDPPEIATDRIFGVTSFELG